MDMSGCSNENFDNQNVPYINTIILDFKVIFIL